MDIIIKQLGKKYGKEWIFKGVETEIKAGARVSITGANGSGKSTLVKILSNYLSASKGTVLYDNKDQSEEPQLKFNFVAPYLNLIEELTVEELLQFHSKFKNPLISVEEMLTENGLLNARKKPIQELSSGMKQRLKLTLSFFYDCDILFLDEPTTNLDEKGVEWYHSLIQRIDKMTTIIVASNQKHEYNFCSNNINLANYK